MKLTRKKAIELCIEAWEILAKTGCKKNELPEKHKKAAACCWFCEYDSYRNIINKITRRFCMSCPLGGKFNKCLDMYYDNWENAKTKKIRKKYAKLFLNQIKGLKT